MLARAQSVSGRPHDALVMLQRLAALGVATDAAEHEDFRRVRALPGWPALQARLAEIAAAPIGAAPASTADLKGDPKRTAATPPATAPPAGSKADPRAETKAPVAPDETRPGAEPATGETTEALRFPAEAFTPAGLAYDAVSNRFIVADRKEKKLIVIGERSQRTSNLIGAESGGFGEIGGIAIDVRQGDLWVASTSGNEKAGARLHKLQLISGRHLMTVSITPGVPPARFVDVVIAADGSVLVLDGSGRRIFRQRPGGLANGHLERLVELEIAAPVSLAPAADAVYVAHADGLARVDLESQRVSQVKASEGVNLSGLSWVRWHRNRLLAVQRSAAGGHQIVRIRLDRNGTASALDVLERDASVLDGAAVALAGDTLFYLTSVPGSSSGTPQHIVRRLDIK